MQNSTYCYLTASSDHMTLEEMAKLTKLNYSNGATKGEKIKHGGRGGYYQYSFIDYKFTDKTSYELEESLNMLLDELEKDKNGIKNLIERTNACINICKHQYISANAGIHFDKEIIRRINELNLDIDIDIYCVGEYMP